MSSIMDMLRPPPGGPLPPPTGLTPSAVPGLPDTAGPGDGGPGPGGPDLGGPGGPGGLGGLFGGGSPDGGSPLPVPPEVSALMNILGVSPDQPQAEGESAQMAPMEHIQAAMLHLMMAFSQEGDHSKGAGMLKGMGALQGLLAGAQKDQAAQQPPPALGG